MYLEPANRNQFMAAVRQDLQERLSRMYPETQVEQMDVNKVQGESYKGLVIRQDGHTASPIFNMDQMYDQLAFRSYENVLNDLVRQAVETIENPLNVIPEEFMDYGFMKDKLMVQVISAEDNAARLTELPHQEMKDMAVIYRFVIAEDNQGSISVAINNAMLETYGISQEQLHEDALRAMRETHPFTIQPLGAVLARMDPTMDEVTGPPGLYVASTETMRNGAGVIVQPDFMEKAAEIIKGDFYVLPSSIHEVLLFKDDGQTNFRDLQNMVRNINEGFLEPSEKLTDNVYHYDAAERVFETGKEHADRVAEKTLGKRESVLQDLADQKQKVKEHTPKARSSPERGGEVL